MHTVHQETEKRWQTFTLWQQLLMIGSEVGRARSCAEGRDIEAKRRCLERALELIDFSIADPRWGNYRLREVLLLRELIADQYSGVEYYHTSLNELEAYFVPFGSLRV